MGRLGLTEILIIVGVALLFFGAGRLADLGKGLGEGIRNFKKGLTDDDDDQDKLPEAKKKGDDDGDDKADEKADKEEDKKDDKD